VLAVLPGAVNGSLRVKSLLPGSQIPGWLLVFAAPVFLLVWTVLLVVLNQPVQSPLLVLGVLLWAGAPALYALRSGLFVRSQWSEQDVARIATVKRTAGLVAISGLALMVAAAFTAKVAGLTMLGADEELALATRLDEVEDASEEDALDVFEDALGTSESFAYALDLSSWQLVLDVLAKLLLATAVFADFVLRAALAAWRNELETRGRTEAGVQDARMEALRNAL
jgi:hypothetical protein